MFFTQKRRTSRFFAAMPLRFLQVSSTGGKPRSGLPSGKGCCKQAAPEQSVARRYLNNWTRARELETQPAQHCRLSPASHARRAGASELCSLHHGGAVMPIDLTIPEIDLQIVIGHSWAENPMSYYQNVRKDGIQIWKMASVGISLHTKTRPQKFLRAVLISTDCTDCSIFLPARARSGGIHSATVQGMQKQP